MYDRITTMPMDPISASHPRLAEVVSNCFESPFTTRGVSRRAYSTAPGCGRQIDNWLLSPSQPRLWKTGRWRQKMSPPLRMRKWIKTRGAEVIRGQIQQTKGVNYARLTSHTLPGGVIVGDWPLGGEGGSCVSCYRYVWSYVLNVDEKTAARCIASNNNVRGCCILFVSSGCLIYIYTNYVRRIAHVYVIWCFLCNTSSVSKVKSKRKMNTS